MKVWRISEDVNNYIAITLNGNESIRTFSKIFDAHSSLLSEWIQKEVRFFDEKGEKKKGDFFYMTSGIHVMNKKACTAVEEFIHAGNAELLPLIVGDEKIFILNTLKFIDCIDIDKSEVEYFPNSNRILAIKNYCFKANKIINEDIFKAIQQPFGSVFISDRLKTKMEMLKIEGIKYELMWDSEA